MEIPNSLITVLLLVPLIAFIYAKLKEKYNFWKCRNVVHEKPVPFVGDYLPVLQFKQSIYDIYDQLYTTYPDEIAVGMYEFLNPSLIVRSPDLIESILIKDFKHFEDQVIVANDGGLLAYTLFQLNGDIWRTLKYKLTQCLTNRKLQAMLDYMAKCADNMVNDIENNHLKQDFLQISQILGTFNADVVAGCVLGMKMDKSAKDIFQEMNDEIFNITPIGIFRILTLLCAPTLAKILGLKFMSKNVDKYWRQMVEKALSQPEQLEEEVSRNQQLQCRAPVITNVAQLLVAFKKQRFIKKHSKTSDAVTEADQLRNSEKTADENLEITDDILGGQIFQFLAGGSDQLSNLLTLCMFELARHPEIQENVRQEIKQVIIEEGYTFESLKKMTYLNQVIDESLRLYPPLPFVSRVCTKTYRTEDGRLQIEKGQKIIIPVTAIHKDPKYYLNPYEFNPDRFNPANKINRNGTYLPFGGGPRICLGKKLSMMEMTLVLAKLIENFKFTLSPKSRLPLEFNKQAFFIKPKYPIFLQCTKIVN